MAKSERIDYYINISKDLINEYVDLRKMQKNMDEMARLDWSLPSGMDDEWIREVKTTAPHDAIRAGVRVLSGLDEHVKIDPQSIPGNLGEFAGNIANQWEIALKWQMDKAARRKAILRQDVIRSALMYDEIVGQITHLPTQIKSIEKMGGSANRQKAALRYGDFVVSLRNPQSVYARWSDYMLEAVLYITTKKAWEIQDFWNNPELNRLIDRSEAAEEWMVFDYVDYERHVVFAIPGTTLDTIVDPDEVEEAIMLLDDEWKHDFLPWSCVVGGTNLESLPHQSRFPLLYGIYKADQWINTNIIGSLQISEAIAEAASPKVKRSGIRPQSVQATYGEPGATWDVPPGHDVESMQRQGLDPALREAYDRYVFEMNQSTLPRVLINAEAGPDETFSGFNLRVQQAMASLLPYKLLGERWFEEAYRLMLMWGKVSKKGITGYSKENFEYVIPAEDIDSNNLYLRVELQQDVPIDRQQKVMTAIQASQHLKLPTRSILEQLGEDNPDKLIEDWFKEQFDLSYLQGVLQQIQFKSSNAIEQIIQQVQQAAMMQAQQQLAQASQGQQQQAQGGLPGVEGQGFNPNAGGLPPAQAVPGATRETQQGVDQAGNMVLGG